MHAALKQIGIYLSPRPRGRILAVNSRLYGLDKPRGPTREKREMPIASARRHEYWTADVRYVDDHRLGGGRVYVISILENHSRAILASAVSRSQDLASYLSGLGCVRKVLEIDGPLEGRAIVLQDGWCSKSTDRKRSDDGQRSS